jgi:hypothetical protein
VSSVLSLLVLKTLISIVILAAGAIVFGCCKPDDFTLFSMCSLPGTTIVAGGLFLIGASLWVGN